MNPLFSAEKMNRNYRECQMVPNPAGFDLNYRLIVKIRIIFEEETMSKIRLRLDGVDDRICRGTLQYDFVDL